MKKTLLSISFLLLVATGVEAQTKKDWSVVTPNANITVSKTVQRTDFPEKFTLLSANFESIKQKLYSADDRFASNAQGVIVEIPNAKGQLEKFQMFESSNFDPALQAQFPDIRAYAGIGIDDKHAQVRLSISPSGIQTMTFRADKATEYIEPYSADRSVYVVYERSAKRAKQPFTCATPDEHLEADLGKVGLNNSIMSSDGVYRTFRLAMSVTGEYSAYHGGTTPSVLAAVNATLTRVNGVYEKDLAIHMNLVNNTTILYLNAGSDPYGNTDANYNSELQSTLTAQVGEANYDIGHLMSAIGNNGNAGCIGCVCTNGQKGSGFTTSTVPTGDNFDIDFVVHEMGHQFGANHSFTFGSENNSVNYEPGSGVTIMGYAGITSYDVAPHSIETFHAGNIAQIQSNMAGKTCDVETAITHSAPVVNAGANYTIPLNTPFALTGSATDAGGAGSMTYQWEQYDEVTSAAQLTTGSPASPTKTAGPNFRTYLPTTSGTRYFPAMSTTLNGSKTTPGTDIIVEALSTVPRTLNFRLTARDNVLNGGQTNFANMVVTVANLGALDITTQNADGISYQMNSTQTINWTSAGNSTIAGGNTVDILFSNDNGATWAYTLATATPNDGSHTVTLPAGVSGAFCRFMVKASGNIFYNVNTKAFAVGYTVTNTCNTYTNSTPLTISDGTGTTGPVLGPVASNNISVPVTYTLSDVNVNVNVTHTYVNDLYIAVNHPDATQQWLWYDMCGSQDNFNITFSDGSPAVACAGNNTTGTFSPAEPLSDFNTKPANGNWSILAADGWQGDTGQINSWSVEVCSQTITLASDAFTGLDDFSIYPNPNNGNFNIKFTSQSSNDVEVIVHDIRGRQVFNKTFQNNSVFNQNIQLNNVESGIYIVTVKDGERKENKKIVIE